MSEHGRDEGGRRFYTLAELRGVAKEIVSDGPEEWHEYAVALAEAFDAYPFDAGVDSRICQGSRRSFSR